MLKVIKYDDKREYYSNLLEKIANSDKNAFASLFAEISPKIKGFLMRLGSTDILAEEILQETMLAVWKKAGYFDKTKASPTTWLFTIARNKRIDFLRKESRPEIDSYDPVLISDNLDTPDISLEHKETSKTLLKQIESLPEKQTNLIKKYFFEDKTQSEISEELNIPLGTVKSSLRLGIAKLKKSLEKEDL